MGKNDNGNNGRTELVFVVDDNARILAHFRIPALT